MTSLTNHMQLNTFLVIFWTTVFNQV